MVDRCPGNSCRANKYLLNVIDVINRFSSHSPQTFPQNIIGMVDRSLFFIAMPASVAQLDAPSDWRPGGRWFNSCRSRQHSFAEIDHEIFSMVILSLPLIQEGQLSVSGKRMCTILVNRLED